MSSIIAPHAMVGALGLINDLEITQKSLVSGRQMQAVKTYSLISQAL